MPDTECECPLLTVIFMADGSRLFSRPLVAESNDLKIFNGEECGGKKIILL